MLTVMTEATVTYACKLEGKDEDLVRQYSADHGCSLCEAVSDLYFKSDEPFDLYRDSSESDFTTEAILEVEED